MLIKLLCCEATKYPTTHPIKNFQIEMLDFAGISKVAAANASKMAKIKFRLCRQNQTLSK